MSAEAIGSREGAEASLDLRNDAPVVDLREPAATGLDPVYETKEVVTHELFNILRSADGRPWRLEVAAFSAMRYIEKSGHRPANDRLATADLVQEWLLREGKIGSGTYAEVQANNLYEGIISDETLNLDVRLRAKTSLLRPYALALIEEEDPSRRAELHRNYETALDSIYGEGLRGLEALDNPHKPTQEYSDLLGVTNELVALKAFTRTPDFNAFHPQYAAEIPTSEQESEVLYREILDDPYSIINEYIAPANQVAIPSSMRRDLSDGPQLGWDVEVYRRGQTPEDDGNFYVAKIEVKGSFMAVRHQLHTLAGRLTSAVAEPRDAEAWIKAYGTPDEFKAELAAAEQGEGPITPWLAQILQEQGKNLFVPGMVLSMGGQKPSNLRRATRPDTLEGRTIKHLMSRPLVWNYREDCDY